MARENKRSQPSMPTKIGFNEEDDNFQVYQHKRRKVHVPVVSNAPFYNRPIDEDVITINNDFIPANAAFKTPDLPKKSTLTLDHYFSSKRPQAQQPSALRTSPKEAEISPRRAAMLKNVDQKLAEEILTTIVDTSEIKMTDILGNNDAKQALEESVIFPTLNPALFSGLRQPSKGILLFGPPGNGKTMLAKAVANESQCTFFSISAATIMSKWIGEGERLMKALFQVARNAQPSIIFIDEVDSMLSERTENENGATRRVKTEFLLQFDGCTTKAEDRVLVLAATNRPQELDDGVLRRFPRRIYIDLPDENTRAHLIKHNFQRTSTNMQISDEELTSIAQACENYSFSDLSALCREAAMFPLKKLSRQQLQSAKPNEISPVTYNDLLAATKLVRASSNLENIRKLKDYAKQFA